MARTCEDLLIATTPLPALGHRNPGTGAPVKGRVLAPDQCPPARSGLYIRRYLKEHVMKQPGLDKRHRDKDGEISRKKSNTLVRTLRKEYGDDFAKGYRSDATLGTVLRKEKVESLHDLLKRKR
jgi:hypothetical protein